MKKFFNDNMWWMVIIAVGVAGYALFRTFPKKVQGEVKETTETVAVETV